MGNSFILRRMHSLAVCRAEKARSKTKMANIPSVFNAKCTVSTVKHSPKPDGLGNHEQIRHCSVVFFPRHHNKWPEICSTASEKAEYTHGGA